MAEGSGRFVAVPAELAAAVDRALERARQTIEQRDRAARRLDEVEHRSGPERALLVARNQRGLSGLGLVMELIRRAIRDRTLDPVTCRKWAEAAVQKAEGLGSLGLTARAWAEKGNAERILEDFAASQASFDQAMRLLEQEGGGTLPFRGDVLSLQGSLEHALRRPEQALACLDEALECYRALGTVEDEQEVLIKRANVRAYQGAFAQAIGDLILVTREALAQEADPPSDHLVASCHNILWILVEASLVADLESDRRLTLELACQGFARLTHLYESCSVPVWQIRHQWLFGRLLLAQGCFGHAERILDRAVAEFLDLKLPATAAVISLDLALALARKGDLGELRAVAGAACVVLEAAGLRPDAWAAQKLLLNCDLASAEEVIVRGLQRAGGASLRRTPGKFPSR